jgi:uncharacterized protein YggU (UPF0235/DUF167 family)
VSRPTTARISIQLAPRSGVDRIEGVIDGVLKARVAAAPVDGAANEALVRLVAGSLGIAPRRVRIVGGASNRRKLIEIEGVEPTELRSRWPGLTV